MEFNGQELDKIMGGVSKHLDKEVTAYLFGGAVMIHEGLKPTTKDIDLLFKTKKELKHFVDAARKAGFIKTKITGEYALFEMSEMLEHPTTKWRLDIFHNVVCKKFRFNDDVEKRAKKIKKIGLLNIYHLSKEDIFIMKSLTERERDLEDMRQLLGFGLDFDALLSEIQNQDKYKIDILSRILQFEDKYSLKLPLSKQLNAEYDKWWNERLKKEVAKQIKEGKTETQIRETFNLTEEELKEML